MDTLIHADIFFFVTTIAVALVTIVFVVVLIYLVRVLRQVEEIGKEIKEETVLFREDLRDLRNNVRHEGFKLKNALDFVANIFKRKKNTRSKRN